MFGWLFGNKKAGRAEEVVVPKPEAAVEDAFESSKQEALESLLGPMDSTVYHSVIPFYIGGGLDLYTFSQCLPGVVFVTQELIGRDLSSRPKAGLEGHFELVAALPPGKVRTDATGVKLINAMLNPMARYAFHAALSPGETAEVPGGTSQPSLPVLLDRFDAGAGDFSFAGEQFHLLLCIALHPTELAFARANGSGPLLDRLKAAGVYPYSCLDRDSVA